MGTGSIFCFRYNGKLYCYYDRYDGYFNGVGVLLIKEILEAMSSGRINFWRRQADRISQSINTKKQYDESGYNNIFYKLLSPSCDIDDEDVGDYTEYFYILDLDDDIFEYGKYMKTDEGISKIQNSERLSNLDSLLKIFENYQDY